MGEKGIKKLKNKSMETTITAMFTLVFLKRMIYMGSLQTSAVQTSVAKLRQMWMAEVSIFLIGEVPTNMYFYTLPIFSAFTTFPWEIYPSCISTNDNNDYNETLPPF